MGYPYQLDGDMLWDAGYHSGRLYLSLVQGAAECLELPTGLTRNDRLGGCDVELPVFRVFVEGLYESYSRTDHNPVLDGLSRGLLVTSLVLLDMAGSPIPLSAEHEEALRGEMGSFGRSMGAANWRLYSDGVQQPGPSASPRSVLPGTQSGGERRR
ncbi:DUF6086 family protein [Streptomyces roseicoloratus]|uniref:DUF6086 family protein n=1 Tax=Streptomyces roseicoloratus TaxID=2508722 RepID=A0ABY9RZR1_9ACTN|nr:DUF6086 family protein [Streptomyces roseicoloratus]WMX47269.1 DUF6086 family protein [Streptomyces roseicoloratus]